MGYFSNGAEGSMYRDQYCDRCVHDVEHNCVVWLAHLLFGYRDCNDKDSILHVLIQRDAEGGNKQCKMFIPVEP